MSRRLALLLAGCLAASSAQAYDSDIDVRFAASSGTPGWRRLYESANDEYGVAIARAPDGGYVVAAQLPGGGAGARIGLFRLDRDGNYVASGFGGGGKVVKDAWLSSVIDMTVDAQGRIVVVGATPGTDSTSDFGVVRFKPDGSDDASFAGDGGAGIPIVTGSMRWDAYPSSVLADPDGRIVVAGSVYRADNPSRFAVVRLNTDGSLDAGFGDFSGTTVSSYADGNAFATKILRVVDGYYLVVGTSKTAEADTDFGARILRPDGKTWAGATGAATFAINVGDTDTYFDTARDAALSSPTRVVVAGTASGRFAAIRLVIGGSAGQYTSLTKDASFTGRSPPGTCTQCYVSGYTSASEATAVGVRSDGRIVVAGRYWGAGGRRYGLVSRLRPDGHPDTSWAGGVVDDTVKAAPTSGGGDSFITGFTDFLFDSGRMVAVGSSVDDIATENDYDAVITRFESDLIFASGLE